MKQGKRSEEVEFIAR